MTKDSETLLDPVLHNNVHANLQVNVKETVITDHIATEIILPFKTPHTGCSTFIVKEYTFLKDQVVNNQFRETLSTSWNYLDFSLDLNTIFCTS